ncbi:hypothetical protein TNCV_495411 [Trichonephila clavipes]|nr:hypothetical protein TNCV_495411 [Trichonephila clavipes]
MGERAFDLELGLAGKKCNQRRERNSLHCARAARLLLEEKVAQKKRGVAGQKTKISCERNLEYLELFKSRLEIET